jgi:hypothetical protein
MSKPWKVKLRTWTNRGVGTVEDDIEDIETFEFDSVLEWTAFMRGLRKGVRLSCFEELEVEDG